MKREPGRRTEPFGFEAQVRRQDRSPLVVAAVVVALIVLAIAKPWAPVGHWPYESAIAARPRDTAIVSPGSQLSASSAPSDGVDAVADICFEPTSWRTATIETWRMRTVRVWRALDPADATGPADPTIQVVPAVGTTIPAIGYCAPARGPDEPSGLAHVDAWQLDSGETRSIELHQVAPDVVSPYGALFGPPGSEGDDATSWPSGTFIFRYVDLETRSERWFGLEVRRTLD